MNLLQNKFEQAFAAARKDLQTKRLETIQAETAVTWCARACASTALLYAGSVSDTREYAHEALEHAALCGDDAVLAFVRQMFRVYGVSA